MSFSGSYGNFGAHFEMAVILNFSAVNSDHKNGLKNTEIMALSVHYMKSVMSRNIKFMYCMIKYIEK